MVSAGAVSKSRTDVAKTAFDLVLVELRTKIGARHAVERVRDGARPGRMLVVGGQRRPERAAGITGRRLHPDVAEAAVAQHLAVGHAVERYAAGETQVFHAGLGGEAAGEAQHGLLEHRLDRCREVHVLLLEPGLGLARRRAEQRNRSAAFVMVSPVQ